MSARVVATTRSSLLVMKEFQYLHKQTRTSARRFAISISVIFLSNWLPLDWRLAKSDKTIYGRQSRRAYVYIFSGKVWQ